MNKEKLFKMMAAASLIICAGVWVPNVVFQVASPWWMVIFIIAPAGIVFAGLIKNYWLIVLNTIMLFSFFILMFTGYFVNSITDGKP
ncbi:hypothetical protein [Halobacillus sp. B23F22_1]|uniref:hypothetical protein n=1 Tax=Halobacillus sp. B23F22_1 TaxID=3459514 RepID=UPI00373F51EB